MNIPVEAQHCFTKALLQVAQKGPRSTHLPTSQMQKRLGAVPKHMLLCILYIYIHVYCHLLGMLNCTTSFHDQYEHHHPDYDDYSHQHVYLTLDHNRYNDAAAPSAPSAASASAAADDDDDDSGLYHNYHIIS